MKKRFLLTFFSWAICCMAVIAQNPVKWAYKVIDDNTDHPSIVVTATVEAGYHLYSQDNPQDPVMGGVQPLVFTLYDAKGITPLGGFTANKNYETEFDDIFMIDQHFYGPGTVVFTQKLKPTAKNWSVTVDVLGQACNASGCVRISSEEYLKGRFESFQKPNSYSNPTQPTQPLHTSPSQPTLSKPNSQPEIIIPLHVKPKSKPHRN